MSRASQPKPTREQLARRIDHTLLRADAGEQDVVKACMEATDWGFRSVIVNPCYISLASKLLAGSDVVVGGAVAIPLGFQTTKVKMFEAQDAIDNGAREIDMLLNVSYLKSGRSRELADEIGRLREVAEGLVAKVVIETCYLTDEEKTRACEIICDAGVDFVKTSTGFGPEGATAHDVRLLTSVAAGRAKVKAAGGIRTLDTALSLLDAGAERLGTSHGVAIVSEL